jgi:hypothetical protein
MEREEEEPLKDEEPRHCSLGIEGWVDPEWPGPPERIGELLARIRALAKADPRGAEMIEAVAEYQRLTGAPPGFLPDVL